LDDTDHSEREKFDGPEQYLEKKTNGQLSGALETVHITCKKNHAQAP
jgi:hypothetical protein